VALPLRVSLCEIFSSRNFFYSSPANENGDVMNFDLKFLSSIIPLYSDPSPNMDFLG